MREMMGTQQLRSSKLLLVLGFIAIVAVTTCPIVLYQVRMRQFRFAQSVVEQSGGSLSFDLQGDYTLSLDGLDDSQIDAVMSALRSLPSGFTFIGPGEGRHFYISLRKSALSEDRLSKVCLLPLSVITIADCPALTDDSLVHLRAIRNRFANINLDKSFSKEAIQQLAKEYPNTYVPAD